MNVFIQTYMSWIGFWVEGIEHGSLVLVGGDPGIGKSTLLLQMFRALSEKDLSLLYISGEESLQQIKMRADRLGAFKRDIMMLCETNLELIETVIRKQRPDIVIIDSIQTMFKEDIASAPGSVSQVRESTGVLMQLAKTEGITIFIVGHVTKEGVVAGPRVLEHMVDTVLYFEGDRHASYRLLRAVKNRFGSTNEIGVFEMRNEGLVEVENPSEYMLNGRPEGASGWLYPVRWREHGLFWWKFRRLCARLILICPAERLPEPIITVSTF